MMGLIALHSHNANAEIYALNLPPSTHHISFGKYDGALKEEGLGRNFPKLGVIFGVEQFGGL